MSFLKDIQIDGSRGLHEGSSPLEMSGDGGFSMTTDIGEFNNNLMNSVNEPLNISDAGGKSVIPAGDGLPGKAATGGEGGFFDRMNNNKMTAGDALGISIASTGFKTAAAMYEMRQNEKMQMEQMQTDFDRAFGAKEFDYRMNRARMNSAAITRMIQSVNAVSKQGANASAEGLGNQTQMFLRDPVTGSLI